MISQHQRPDGAVATAYPLGDGDGHIPAACTECVTGGWSWARGCWPATLGGRSNAHKRYRWRPVWCTARDPQLTPTAGVVVAEAASAGQRNVRKHIPVRGDGAPRAGPGR